MASYLIIGGDTKEYGPVTGDDIRLWIAEGRLSAQTLAKGDGDASWRTLGSFPEFADLFGANAPATIAPLRPGAPASAAPASTDFLERDYELDIGGCISGGWNLVKSNFGTLLGCFVVLVVISMVCGAALNAVFGLFSGNETIRQIIHLASTTAMALVMGPMTGGIYYVFLRASRSQPTNIGEMFIGFQKNFKELFLGYLVVAFLISLCLIPYNVVSDAKVLPLMVKMQQMQSTTDTQALMSLMSQLWPAFLGILPVLLVCLIPVTYLSVNWQFTLPLIVDKQMPFWTAMKTSWKMVHKHWWQVFGLTVVIGLVILAGFLVCCIGALFTMPVGIAAMMIAYETIFNARKN